MMMQQAPFCRFAALLCLLLMTVRGLGDDRSETDRLIEQLGDRKYSQRQDATRRLQARGLDVLDALQAATHQRNPEIRHRAEMVLARLGEASEKGPLRGHDHWVRSVAFSPDSLMLASGDDAGLILIWDVVTSQRRAILKAIDQDVTCMSFSPDGKTLATAGCPRGRGPVDYGVVRLWDSREGKLKRRIRVSGLVYDMAFSPIGKTLALACMDHTVQVWDTVQFRQLANLRGHKDRVVAVAFSPDGEVLASAGKDNTVRLWSLSGAELASLRVSGEHYAKCLTFSPGGQSIAMAMGDGHVSLWDVAARKERLRFKTDLTGVWCLTFSADARTLALGAFENGRPRASLWDARTGVERITLGSLDAPDFSVAIAPDGKKIAAASWDGLVKFWQIRVCPRLSGSIEKAAPVPEP